MGKLHKRFTLFSTLVYILTDSYKANPFTFLFLDIYKVNEYIDKHSCSYVKEVFQKNDFKHWNSYVLFVSNCKSAFILNCMKFKSFLLSCALFCFFFFLDGLNLPRQLISDKTVTLTEIYVFIICEMKSRFELHFFNKMP